MAAIPSFTRGFTTSGRGCSRRLPHPCGASGVSTPGRYVTGRAEGGQACGLRWRVQHVRGGETITYQWVVLAIPLGCVLA